MNNLLQRSLGFQPDYSREIPTGKMAMLRLGGNALLNLGSRLCRVLP